MPAKRKKPRSAFEVAGKKKKSSDTENDVKPNEKEPLNDKSSPRTNNSKKRNTRDKKGSIETVEEIVISKKEQKKKRSSKSEEIEADLEASPSSKADINAVGNKFESEENVTIDISYTEETNKSPNKSKDAKKKKSRKRKSKEAVTSINLEEDGNCDEVDDSIQADQSFEEPSVEVPEESDSFTGIRKSLLELSKKTAHELDVQPKRW